MSTRNPQKLVLSLYMFSRDRLIRLYMFENCINWKGFMWTNDFGVSTILTIFQSEKDTNALFAFTACCLKHFKTKRSSDSLLFEENTVYQLPFYAQVFLHKSLTSMRIHLICQNFLNPSPLSYIVCYRQQNYTSDFTVGFNPIFHGSGQIWPGFF